MSSRVRYFPRYTPGQPVVIRQVIRLDAKGKPKVARDRKAEFTMERITAGVARDCRANCGYLIIKGERFARLTHPGWTKQIGRRHLLDPVDYHFDCVPKGAKPLVRFLRF